ncbi:MAG: AMP-binding protein [Pseudomonadota bacterium]
MAKQAKASPEHPWLDAYPSHVRWDEPIEAGTLIDLIDHACKTYPERPHLTFFGRTLRYRQTQHEIELAAAALQAFGIIPGDRIALMLPNCPASIIFYFAIAKCGAVIVNINPLLNQDQIEEQVRAAGAAHLITTNLRPLVNKVRALVDDGTIQRVVLCPLQDWMPLHTGLAFRLLRRADLVSSAEIPAPVFVTWKSLRGAGRYTAPRINPTDPAVLQFTGGTTGESRAAVLTHENIYINVIQCRRFIHNLREGQEAILVVLPLFHVFAMTALMCLGSYIGARLVLLPRLDIKTCAKVLRQFRVTMLVVVPSLVSALLPSLRKWTDHSLRVCVSGGAPLPEPLRQDFVRATGTPLVEGYGLTEAAPVVCVGPLEPGAGKPGSVGLPLPGTVVEVIDQQDRKTPMPIGEHGEICVTGRQVMQGYDNRQKDTAEVLRSGRLHTGDIGYMDEDGYIFIVDRLKQLIIVGGYNVYPRRVEDAFYRHPAVAECAVIGLPDRVRGEVVTAYVVRKQAMEVTATELKTFVAEHLTSYERPREVIFKDDLPKTLIGKSDHRTLKAQELERREMSHP